MRNNSRIPKRLLEADRLLFKIGKRIEILNKINWPAGVKNTFLKSWNKKNPKLPKIHYPKFCFGEEKNALIEISKIPKSIHPLSFLVVDTAKSYLLALKMIESVGKHRFTLYSKELYGAPDNLVSSLNYSTLKAAQKLLKQSKKFDIKELTPNSDYCILPETVVKQVKKASKKYMADAKLKVVTDFKIPSKASASPNKIKIRADTCFAKHDIQQLIQHELLVHTLTILNGRTQPLKSLGLNSPRTTSSQEGLAVFAEFITNSMDMFRLVRISSRVKAIEMGLNDADFIDVFKYFIELGDSEEESFYSASRIFRGGNVKGRTVFTKDMVYLKGFIEVHELFLKSIQDKKFIHPEIFISGRMSTHDVERLAPFYDSKFLKLPKYVPDWINDRSTLLAFLLSSSVMNQLGMSRV